MNAAPDLDDLPFEIERILLERGIERATAISRPSRRWWRFWQPTQPSRRHDILLDVTLDRERARPRTRLRVSTMKARQIGLRRNWLIVLDRDLRRASAVTEDGLRVAQVRRVRLTGHGTMLHVTWHRCHPNRIEPAGSAAPPAPEAAARPGPPTCLDPTQRAHGSRRN